MSTPISKVPMCILPECTKQAQTRRLCKAHGGGVRCRTPGCPKFAQSQRLCVAHGGGRRCQFAGCAKLAQYKGLCLAHGGGRRCRVSGCLKYVQVRGCCRAHYNLLNEVSVTPRPSPGKSSQKEGKLDYCALVAATASKKTLTTPRMAGLFNTPPTLATGPEYASWAKCTSPLSGQVDVDVEPSPSLHSPLELYRPACRQVYCQRRKV